MPSARGRGLGRRLLYLVTRMAPQARARPLTARRATDTVAFSQRAGWHEADLPPQAGNDILVFLAPQHPHAAG